MQSSGIRQILDALADRPDAIRLMVGDPDFSTPPHILEAADRAVRDGGTHYTQTAGIMSLREAAADKIWNVNGYKVLPENVVVSAGGLGALASTILTVADVGDNILVPDPGWPNFVMACHLLGVEPRPYLLDSREGYIPSIPKIGSLIDTKTKAVLINNPSNPLGTIAPDEVVDGIIRTATDRGIWVISDECYDQLVYSDGAFHSPAAYAESGNIISVYSFSKTYAMTGWRVGYAALPSSLTKSFIKAEEATYSCMSTPGQYAALAALTGPQQCVKDMIAVYERRRNRAVQLLRANGISVEAPVGAFYLWLELDNLRNPREFPATLADAGVGVAPGETFGASGTHSLRISLSSSDDDLDRGLRLLARLYEKELAIM